jgi:glucan phosphoethanolaminetransferase (alkaline phosphatase superfamily)
MLKKFLNHILLAITFTCLTLAQQYFFYHLKNIPIVWLSLGKYVGIFIFLLSATFIRPQILRFLFLSFVMLLNFFQMAHLSYFGTQILPSEILLLFTHFDEIQGTILVELHHILIPLLLTLIPVVFGLWLTRLKSELYGTKIIGVLFVIYFIYNPARTLITGNTWGRQPSTRELAGMNVYLSLSYFAGKILPHKILRNKKDDGTNSSTDLYLSEGSFSEWDHIILVLGESLTPHHMSLFGYERETTPFLSSLKKDPRFVHTIGLSGGVSTDIAVAFLLNMGFGEAGALKAAKGQHCLFKLAKEKKFTTHFLSVQSAEQLRYIAPYLCAASLDDYRSLEDISPETKDDQAADDRLLLPELNKLTDFKNKQFIMLHQRGSHAPWELRSLSQNRLFPHDDKVNHYDNSVVEFDTFFKDLDAILRKSSKKTLVIYVSDHGEGLGEDGKWGHGQLFRSAFEVPVIIMSYNKDLPADLRLIPKFIPHFNISVLIARELGFRPSIEVNSLPKDYVIFGNDIDGFAGKAKLLFSPDSTYDFKVVD